MVEKEIFYLVRIFYGFYKRLKPTTLDWGNSR